MTSWSLWGKKENISNLNSPLSCSIDLVIENPDRSSKLTKNKSSCAFPKLRELRFENSENVVISENKQRGGIMFYINKNITCRELKIFPKKK